MININNNFTSCIEDTLYAMQQRNLVYNYNFLYFSNKKKVNGSIEYNHPDGWIYDDKGANAQIYYDNGQCIIIVNSESGEMIFKQALHEFPRWHDVLRGEMVSLRACLLLSEQSKVTVSLSDGITQCTQEVYADKKEEYLFDLQLRVNEKAESLYCIISSQSSSAVIGIRKVFANIGAMAIENLPCIVNGIIGERRQYIATENPPVEELSLCNVPMELSHDQTRLNSVLNKRFGVGNGGRSLLPDVRGYFSRSWNNGAIIDTNASNRVTLGNDVLKGDFVGTVEDDVFKKHKHQLKYSSVQIIPGTVGIATGLILGPSDTEETGDEETRPKNIAELYTIKWC